MAIYTFPDGFVARIKSQRLSVAGDASIAGGGSFGDASSDTVGFGGKSVVAQPFASVSGAAASSLAAVVDVLQAFGIMGAS